MIRFFVSGNSLGGFLNPLDSFFRQKTHMEIGPKSTHFGNLLAFGGLKHLPTRLFGPKSITKFIFWVNIYSINFKNIIKNQFRRFLFSNFFFFIKSKVLGLI